MLNDLPSCVIQTSQQPHKPPPTFTRPPQSFTAAQSMLEQPVCGHSIIAWLQATSAKTANIFSIFKHETEPKHFEYAEWFSFCVECIYICTFPIYIYMYIPYLCKGCLISSPVSLCVTCHAIIATNGYIV